MSGIKVDIDKEKFRILMLDRNGASELKPLILKKRQKAVRNKDTRLVTHFNELLGYVNLYLTGQVDLRASKARKVANYR